MWLTLANGMYIYIAYCTAQKNSKKIGELGYGSLVPYCLENNIFYLMTNFQPEFWIKKTGRKELQPETQR